MTAPDNCRYTPDHEWVRLDGDIVTIGITDHAQDELSDVVFVELPDLGDVDKASPVGVVESVKAASDIYAPLAGEVVEVNLDLVADPSMVNSDPYDGGWIFKMKIDDTAQYEALMDASSYTGIVR
ncbi:MAG: glycine cleavage system protein GcvH [Akkermansiaceae bacterium]|mgnify:FL=1|jgi:glycine cleavage system H protein|tara:strand:+ start:702 stop:1076 length:375 start_codon:yes stop_codon:yes gene_type:complete